MLHDNMYVCHALDTHTYCAIQQYSPMPSHHPAAMDVHVVLPAVSSGHHYYSHSRTHARTHARSCCSAAGASHPRRTPRHEHAHSSLVTGPPNDGASAPFLLDSHPSFCLCCLSRPYRTVQLPPKTPSSHHLGRHPANTHICRPLIETRPTHANRAIRPARQHHR